MSRNSHHRPGVRVAYLALGMMVGLLAILAPGCQSNGGKAAGGGPSCSGDQQAYKQSCVSVTTAGYLGCIQGLGWSTDQKISGGVSGFRWVAKVSLNFAYEKSRKEDSPVALQIVKDCFTLAGRDSNSEPERRVAQVQQRQVTKYVEKDWTCDPSDLEGGVTEVDQMTFELTVTNNASSPCALREPLDILEDDNQKPLGAMTPSGNNGDPTLEPGRPVSAGTFGWSEGVCPDGLTIDFTPPGSSTAFTAQMPVTECTSGTSGPSPTDSGSPPPSSSSSPSPSDSVAPAS